ncbi:MAG: hypothetical protein ACRD22_16380 [Terriglobia bacterium]
MSTTQDELFYSDLEREDDVGLVLRGQLHIEHQLMAIANAVLPFADRCKWGKFAYRSKVELAYACGLPQDVRCVLLKLGNLRNEFAHDLNATISKQRALDLYNCQSERLRIVLQDTYKLMTGKPVFSLKSIEPRDLVTIIFLTMHSATKAAAATLEGNAS